jgi:formylglycine-generating enzyme
MIQRALALILAAAVLPIAAGSAFDQPSPRAVSPGRETAKIPAQRSAFASPERNAECNSVTPADLLAAVTKPRVEGTGTQGGETGCPAGMLLVQGEYCTEVRHTCKRWLDDEKLQYARCAEYEQPARCVGKRSAMRFCIDREEYTPPGADVPMNYASFVTASKVCKDLGKRICTESEWNFACEGEEMRPYPYGWTREPKCNQDREDLYVQTPSKMLLKDHREPATGRPECTSPFGVLNMVGNLDEPVLREAARYNQPFRNGLKGGWWMAGRNRCRPATTAHDDYYQDIQVGVRCCDDTSGGATEPSG